MKKIFLFATLILGLGLMSCQSPESKARKALQEHFDKNADDPESVEILDVESVDTISFTKKEIENLSIQIEGVNRGLVLYRDWLKTDSTDLAYYRSLGKGWEYFVQYKLSSIIKNQDYINELEAQKVDFNKKIYDLNKLVGTDKEDLKVVWVFNVRVGLPTGGKIKVQTGVINDLDTDIYKIKLKKINLFDIMKTTTL